MLASGVIVQYVNTQMLTATPEMWILGEICFHNFPPFKMPLKKVI